ncbi:MAG: hypothetical protein RL375_4132 [Pseudomonadota bacterium]
MPPLASGPSPTPTRPDRLGRVGHAGHVATGQHGQARFQVLAGQFGVFVELKVTHAGDDGRQAAEPAALAGPVGIEEVDDAVGGNALALRAQASGQDAGVAGVLVPEPVADDAAKNVVFDAVDDLVGPGGAVLAAGVEPVDFKQLQLQGDG